MNDPEAELRGILSIKIISDLPIDENRKEDRLISNYGTVFSFYSFFDYCNLFQCFLRKKHQAFQFRLYRISDRAVEL